MTVKGEDVPVQKAESNNREAPTILKRIVLIQSDLIERAIPLNRIGDQVFGPCDFRWVAHACRVLPHLISITI
jgi:hypothetical protein